MKGIVFNVLEECVRREHGEDAWDELLERAGLDGSYTSLATYPDAQLGAIVAAASEMLATPPEEVVRWFGRGAAGSFASKYPGFFEGHTTTRSFLLTLNNIIHPEVRKLYPEAQTPSFEFETHPDGRLAIHYFSERRLCAFADGLIVGSAPHFGESATVEHAACAQRGDAHCILLVGFAPRAA